MSPAPVAIGRDAIGNVIVTGDGNTVAVTLTVMAADPRLHAPAVTSADNPYRGLDAFRETDSAVFFGRDDLVHKLWTRLHALQHPGALRLLPIVGASGSGKSSLVRAGLVPELVRQPMDRMRKPTVVVLRPGARPLEQLADALAPLGARPSVLDAVDAVHRAARAGGDPDARVLVFVDQLEELFTECASEPARAAFLATLVHAAAAPDGVVSVVVAMRNDFAGALRGYDGFARALREQRFMVSPMTKAQLVEAIEKPAAALGRAWPGGLVENLVLQCDGRAGALPLLQFALKRLWPAHAAGTLEAAWSSRLIEDYLVEAADALVDAGDGDPAARTRILRRAFIAMAQLGEGTADTRRVARLSEIVARGETAAQVRGVLAPFVAAEARLVIASELDGEPAYELAHEALIGAWDRLREWLGRVANKADAEAVRGRLRLHRRLWYAAAAWRGDRGALLRPPSLAAAEALRRDHGEDLPPVVDDFIDASVRARRARDRARRWLFVGGVAAVLATAVVIGVFGLIARQRGDEAEHAREEAERARVAAERSEQAVHAQLATTYLEQGRASLFDGAPMKALAYLVAARAEGLDSPVLRMLYARAAPVVPIAAMKHNGRVRVAAYSPDGTRVVTSSDRDPVRVWDARTGRLVVALGTHDDIMRSAAFSPDGARVITGSEHANAQVWDASTGALVNTLAIAGPINAVAFSPDGTRVVAASSAHSARIWDAATGQAVTAPLAHNDIVHTAVWSPDSTRVVTTSGNDVQIWDARTGRRVTSFAHRGPAESAVFSPDGARVVSASDDHTARVWDARTGQSVTPPLTHDAEVGSVAFSADGARVLTASNDGTARVWDVRTGHSLVQLEGHDWVNSAAFSPDGMRVVVASVANTAQVWDARIGQSMTAPFEHRGEVTSAVFSPDGTHVLTASTDGMARIWDAGPGAPTFARGAQVGTAKVMAVSADGAHAVIADWNAAMTIWDVRTGEVATAPREPSAHVMAASFSGDGARVVTVGADSIVRLWDARTAQLSAAQPRATDPVAAAVFSPDGARLLTTSGDGYIAVWDTRTGALVRALPDVTSRAAFSPDGARVITTGAAPRAQIWDLRTGEIVATTGDHGAPVETIAFSPDGTRVVTGGYDGTARVWDARSGQRVGDPFVHRGPVMLAVFSPDGTRLATTSNDHSVWIWDVATSRLHAELDSLGEVTQMTFSPDGAFLFTDGPTHEAALFDVRSGQAASDPLVHFGPSASVSFRSDGVRVISFNDFLSAQVWDLTLASGSLADWREHARCDPLVLDGGTFKPNPAPCP